MSVFAQLLMRAKDALRRKHRQPMTMHFDWDFDGPLDASWKVWCDLGPLVTGSTGEEALRRFVDAVENAS